VQRTLTAGVTAVTNYVHRYHGPYGLFERTWSSGSMALWMMVMLLAFLVAAYVW
jgi:hypothetical protein